METATKHLGFSVIFIYFSSPFPKACVGDYKGTLPPYRDENSAPRALSHLVNSVKMSKSCDLSSNWLRASIKSIH